MAPVEQKERLMARTKHRNLQSKRRKMRRVLNAAGDTFKALGRGAMRMGYGSGFGRWIHRGPVTKEGEE
jgi:hypothetical protein